MVMSRSLCGVQLGQQCCLFPGVGLLLRARPARQCPASRSTPPRQTVVAAAAGGNGYGDGDRTRRGMVLAAGALALALLTSLGLDRDPAHAFSLGISGPKDWLREQKKKTSQFLLAPILASRDRLQSAVFVLNSANGITSSSSYQEAEELVKRASRDCMAPEAGSVIDLQSRSGIQVCTFRLILKNAASLLDKADPVRLKADAALDELIQAFNTLDQFLATGAAGDGVDRASVMKALQGAGAALDEFEGGIRACLGIPAA